MKRTVLCLFLATCLVAALLASAGLAAPKKKKKKPLPPPGPVVVATDVAGDWGSAVNASLAPIGDALGQDLLEGVIDMADATTLKFVIKVTSLPSIGGVPESSRYNWDLNVDGVAFQMTGAFTEYLRGICSPLHTGSCPPPRDPGPSPFFIRQGPCTVGADCFLLATVQSTFDPSAGTITIPVPLEVFKAVPGSVVGPGVSTFGPAIYAAPAAFVSNTAGPSDTMDVLATYTVPPVP